MKCLRLLLNSILIIVALSAPLSTASAAPISSGRGDGSFDCLVGNLDWGCQIINHLFSPTDNTVYYWKDNKVVEDHPIAAIGALRVLLGFFSNALLVIASIMLLYELLQMTAETAHTGQIGGKDTNRLWAPIRVVIGIGLLVPLTTSGLGSGQYIVMQIAKWGSGFASQGWRQFAQALSEDQTLSPPSVPRVRTLAINTLKSYACMYIVNHFAQASNSPKNRVIDETEPAGDASRVVFHSQFANNVCGTITFKVPKTGNSNYNDAQLSLQLTQMNHDDFIRTMPNLRQLGFDMADFHLPEQRATSPPSTNAIDDAVQEYQTAVAQRLRNKSITQNALKEITTKVQQAADTQGWTSAGSWFLAITRAQGQIITGGLNIPDASGPDIAKLASTDESAAEAYGRFEAWLNDSYREQDKLPPQQGSSGTTAGGWHEMTVGEERSYFDSIRDAAEGAGQVTIDKVLGWLDDGAQAVGLWDSDPRKAFGDLGASQNPFGEMAALGHRKIRLGLDYFGLAILTSAGGGVLEAAGSAAPNKSGPMKWAGRAAAVVGKGFTVISGIIILIATLFLLAGVVLAYIVPMLPFTRFFFAIMTWLASLIEAMVLVPFMSLGFLTPKGEGLAGPNTKTAFFLIFQVFLRPILCVIGLVVSMILFYVVAKFLNASFYEATSGIGVYEGSAMKFMQKLVYSVMYVALIYTAANTSFKMIEHLPKHALRWMGGSAQEESYDDHGSFGQLAGAVGGQQLISNLSSLPEKFTGALTLPAQAIAGKITATRDAVTNAKRYQGQQNAQMLSAGFGRRQGVTDMESPDAVVQTAGTPGQIKEAEEQVGAAEAEQGQITRDIANDTSSMATAPAHEQPAIAARITANRERLTELNAPVEPPPRPGVAARARPSIADLKQRVADLKYDTNAPDR
jgi:conjugal transfer/type IV secretion protein DotA/TraY